MIKHRLIYVFLLTFILQWSSSYAQELRGKTVHVKTGEEIPIVNIWIKGTTIGTTSNAQGRFRLSVPEKCTLYFSLVGYQKDSLVIDGNAPLFVTKKLFPQALEIGEVTVQPNYEFDKWMYKQVLKHRKENREKLNLISSYTQESTTAVLLSTNEKTKWVNNAQLQQYTLALTDSTPSNLLPVYMVDEQYAVRQTPKKKEKEVLSKHKEGIFPMLNQQIETMVLSEIAIDFDFYQNQIVILDRGFISPLSTNALLYYNIYLSDSLVNGDDTFYQFRFYPKNEHSVVFSGHFWVEDGTFALTQINAHLSSDANLNFITDLDVSVNYKKTKEGVWFYNAQQVEMKFSFNAEVTNAEVASDMERGEFNILQHSRYSTADNAPMISQPVFFQETESLLGSIGIRARENMQAIKENKLIRTVDDVGGLLLFGYYTKGIFDIGPSFDMYATNRVEGHRFVLPVRTNQNLYKNLSLGGFLGYATRSKHIKYGATVQWALSDDKDHTVKFELGDRFRNVAYKKQMDFIKENPFSKGQNNLITALTAGVRNPFIVGERFAQVEYRGHISNDVCLIVNPYYSETLSTQLVSFKRGDLFYRHFSSYGMMLTMRLAFDQTYDQHYFSRLYYTNLKPIFHFSVDAGEVFLPGSDALSSPYVHSHASMKMRFNFGMAYAKVMANVGYIYGDVPYTMLETPAGSQSMGYARFDYNLLYQASVAHNVYSNLHFNFNGGGFILNQIPIISEMHWREMFSFKCYYGQLNNSYEGLVEVPNPYRHTMSKPYMEAGIGFSNIMKVLRIEYVRRIGDSPILDQYSYRWGVRLGIEISF